MKIEYENTFRKALADGINLFLGAGFSVLAQGADKKPLPVGGQLADELVSKFGAHDLSLSGLNLPQICQVLAAHKKNELRDFLRRRFTVDSYDKCYDALLSVNAPAILTTNVDNLVPRIFEHGKARYIRDITQSGPSADNTAVHYAPLHGSVLQGENFVFTARDIAQAFSSDPDKWHFFTQMLQQRPTLFWGCSLDDADVLNALHPDTVKRREHKQKWILLPGQDPGRDEYFKAMEYSIIRGDTREMLDYMAKHAHGLRPAHPPTVKTSVLFPQDAVPMATPAGDPRRSLTEFFLGDEPTWGDIFSGRLYQSSHYVRIAEHINSGTNALVLGIPASGKTTLLMQIATGIPFNGHKLILRSPSLEKAKMILRQLDGAKALCFVDNFADYTESFLALAKAKNVVTVGFDRDYNYEIFAHRLRGVKFEITDVTELSDIDIQNMFDAIPEGLRCDEPVRPRTQEGLPPSLYEIVDANVLEQGLATRYEDALRQIRKSDIMMHDLLVMCGYVQFCRTPVSYDMIHAFLRGEISDWRDVYDIVSKLGNMVTEYTGQTVDADQDHFSLRSSIVAKAIMSKVEPEDLQRVLRRFHTEVSTLRICDYNIFKRGAYDAKIIGRAFPDVDEGKDFYKKVRMRDESPYALQQGALYLFYKGQKKDAFDWVDQANERAGGRAYSIRNTYAVILFGVNIYSQGDPERKAQTLKQCMNILSECYRSGKRKTYHAVTFARQALMYYGVYKDDVAVEYLHTAKRWLQEERARARWLRNVQHWLKKVSFALEDHAARKK